MNAKLEAEILNIREDLFTQTANIKINKEENEKLILELHKEKVRRKVLEGSSFIPLPRQCRVRGGSVAKRIREFHYLDWS